MNLKNLDQLCARFGYEMCRNVNNKYKDGDRAENLITKSLGVLQEDGVYAFFLYQDSRGDREKEGAKQLKRLATKLLKEVPISPFDSIDDPLKAVRGNGQVRGLVEGLDDLLLAKRLLEQALIYARYHAKALGQQPSGRS